VAQKKEIEYRRTKVYVRTFQETDDPPWVLVTTRPSEGDLADSREAIEDEQARKIRTVAAIPRRREAERMIEDSNRQARAIMQLLKAKEEGRPFDETALATARATRLNLSKTLENDLELWESVRAYNAATRVEHRNAENLRVAAFIVCAGGDFEACGIDMSRPPSMWVERLLPEDRLDIIEASTVELEGEELQDLSTPRSGDSATRRPKEPTSDDSGEQAKDGSSYTETISAAPCGTQAA